ncbi:hypothetical protein FRC20_008765, partial [Serendipita sp. 405]
RGVLGRSYYLLGSRRLGGSGSTEKGFRAHHGDSIVAVSSSMFLSRGLSELALDATTVLIVPAHSSSKELF